MINHPFIRNKLFMQAIVQKLLLVLIFSAGLSAFAAAQQPDSTIRRVPEDSLMKTEEPKAKKDSVVKPHSPRVAAIRSALVPGLGQIYNKKYWKLPIVYGALGACTGIFVYNFGNYKDTRFAYKVKYNMRVNHTDSALFSLIKPKLKPLSEESLRFYRNQFRRDIDYSALAFLLLWGLNVLDATVDAHLHNFDVGPDLGFHLKAGYSDMAKTNGISLVWKIGK
ncbi:MAG: hypothetical protein IPP73_00875 [Chitinophagaceae bacterium]|nr:hypothetical protein [Chitinophagaceae bacterium]